MAKKKGCLFKIGIALLIFIGLIFVLFCMVLIMPSEEYETVNYDIPNMRDYYTHIKGNGEDKVTLMVYMVGSDLESDGGAASEDIAEMRRQMRIILILHYRQAERPRGKMQA